MAFDEDLADRVREALKNRNIHFDEKRMFGGICFMVDRKMCVGVSKARLLVRLDPTIYEKSLLEPGCVPMEFTGKPMRGFVFVNAEGTRTQKTLRAWIDLALEFNPQAKASGRKSGSKSSRARTTTTVPRTASSKKKR